MWAIITDGVTFFVGFDREPCKNGWTDKDAVWDVDLGGPKQTLLDGGLDTDMWRGNFEGKKGLGKDMPDGWYTESDSAGGSSGMSQMPTDVY